MSENPGPETAPPDHPAGFRLPVQVMPREYAGKCVAWSADGRRIVAVADDFEGCEHAAALAGHPTNQVAIERVPESWQRVTGSGL